MKLLSGQRKEEEEEEKGKEKGKVEKESSVLPSFERTASFSSPTADLRQCLENVMAELNKTSGNEIPRHIISKMLRAVTHAEFVTEKEIALAKRTTAAIQCLIDEGRSCFFFFLFL